MKKGEQMFPNVIPKLESGNPLRKGSPKSSIDNFKCFPSKRGAPPLHDQLESVKSKVREGPHTLGAPLGA
jgi:hypothetical protein